MTWNVPKIWEDGDVWILGGGPSVTQQFGIPNSIVQKVLEGSLLPNAYSPYMSPLHSKHVIGINVAYLIGDWIDVVFFGDKNFFLKHQERLAKFSGMKISCHPMFDSIRWVKYLERDKKHIRGISSNSTMVSWNGNSGAAAISMAANAGAKRIILLGFDMKLQGENQQHWHDLYGRSEGLKDPKSKKKLPFHKHLIGFPVIAQDAKARGIEILNVSSDSEIECFKKVSLEEIL